MALRRPDVYVRPNTTNLWIRYYNSSGKLVRRSAGTTDETTARQILQQCLKEVEDEKQRQGGTAPAKVKITISKTITTAAGRERTKFSLSQSLNISDLVVLEKLADDIKKNLLRLLQSGTT